MSQSYDKKFRVSSGNFFPIHVTLFVLGRGSASPVSATLKTSPPSWKTNHYFAEVSSFQK